MVEIAVGGDYKALRVELLGEEALAIREANWTPA
jgi:hypothetical protein